MSVLSPTIELQYCCSNESHACDFSWYQKVSDSVKLGVMKTTDGDLNKYGIAVKYSPTEHQTIRVG